jgi:antitoxin component of RelBE/YafQ-DinJ toxin-antitoxin module
MKTAVINLKVEPGLKAKAQKRARQLGVPLSYVLHTQLLNFTRGEKVELPAEAATPKLERLIAEVEAEVAAGEVSPSFDADDIAGMKRWLESTDDD